MGGRAAYLACTRTTTRAYPHGQAAAMGDLDAMYRLGQNYQRGVGTTKDIYHAFELFEAAANRGHAPSMYALAILYMLGQGTEKNNKKAQELVKQSAALGCMQAQAAMQATNLFTDSKADLGRGRMSASNVARM